MKEEIKARGRPRKKEGEKVCRVVFYISPPAATEDEIKLLKQLLADIRSDLNV